MGPELAGLLSDEGRQVALALALGAIALTTAHCASVLGQLKDLYSTASEVCDKERQSLRKQFSDIAHLKLTPRQASQLDKKALLTPNEQEFYQRLNRALPHHVILAQVSMGALIDVSSAHPSQTFEIRETFSRKVVDYVVCDRSLKVIALVELDDRTHDPLKDAARDELTRAAGYRTLRWDSRSKPTEREIAEAINSLSGSTPSQ